MAWFRDQTRTQEDLLQARAPGATVRRISLRGRVVTMNGASDVISDAYVCIEENFIVHVGPVDKPVPLAFSQVPAIDTGGSIFPGLVELHNHPSYNAIPLWDVPGPFQNRAAWRQDSNYFRKVSRPASLLTHNALVVYPKAVARYVECRALLGGVTTTQGLTLTSLGDTKAYYEGLIRNVEFPNEPGWPVADDWINDFSSYQDAEAHYGKVVGDPQKPFVIHLAEGIDAAARTTLQTFRRPDGSWLIDKNLIAIHATGLQMPDFHIMANSGGIVWSPLSNLLLYGDTTRVQAAKQAGLPIAIGSDWAPSGTKNLLGELKIAKLVSDHAGGIFSDRDLVRMVTCIPASMLGWKPFVGSVEPGKAADLLIIDGQGGDPYVSLLAATESDVIAVIVDGRPRAGRASVIDPRTAGVEMIHLANQDVVLDVIESPNHPLANVPLSSAIGTLSYGLEHLPELATHFSAHHAMMHGSTEHWAVRLEMDEELAMNLTTGAAPIGPGDVDPMKLDPITAVDDATFVLRLKANPNLPTWLKTAL
jgi:5-methylthioadenosine/S-adenosylhomocysteine deaminase